ncbi:MarR family winged helix-turn-helix transcriptional regulator [Nocardioides sp. TRM66260-LWL]|uniref:MarR family winged helix-turn-helix transcriptional regulator n=1 Tax=Nocardioides sp. TRM66260-LWL TaxID=2874478 RepID=UPI001CC779B1|nr:MarR family winged helix-turn-helix transcriptional regulator [Nocardioides sp. TRM66260-LWL]MBZ5735166.1 MarR family winged helix-turn-helix transcriptional regulator [Nocardioides sp. TRM66260-LWL]
MSLHADAPARTDLLLRLEQEVGGLVRRLRRIIAERARAVHPELQSSSYLLLAHVAETGPVRAASLVCHFQIDKGAISRQLQHLIDLGLVERTPDPADGRAHLVSVSDDALRRLDEVSRQRRSFIDERLGSWSPARLAAFVDELAAYNLALDEPDAGA